MANKAQAFFESWPEAQASMKAHSPEVGRAFGPFFQGLMKEGALTVREKELVSLGIAVAVRCEPCIFLHTQKALRAGAKPDEIMEAAGVAVMMGGGPASTYAPLVAQALDYLHDLEVAA